MTVDEGTFEVPERLRRRVLPRRDGLLVTATYTPMADAARRYDNMIVYRYDTLWRRLGAFPADLQAEITAVLRDQDASPLAHACVVVGADADISLRDPDVDPVVDRLVEREGVAFCAEVVALAVAGRTPAWPALPASDLHVRRWHRRHPRRKVLADRMRTALAALNDEAELAAARERLGALRGDDLDTRVVTSYLLPSERAWVEADARAVLAARDGELAFVLLQSVASVDLLDALVGLVVDECPWMFSSAAQFLSTPMTIADGVGPGAAAALMRCYREGGLSTRAERAAVLDVVELLPHDDALTLLLLAADDPIARAALTRSLHRFPRRGLRVLAAGDRSTATEARLVAHAAAHRSEAEEALASGLGGWAAAAVTAGLHMPADAVASDVPAILVEPPWNAKRRRPTVIDGLRRPTTVRFDLSPRERDRWSADLGRPMAPEQIEEALAQRDQRYMGWRVFNALACSDRDRVVEVLDTWRPNGTMFVWKVRSLVARHDVATHGLVVDMVRRVGVSLAWLLMPFESVAVVDLVTGWSKRRSLRRAAVDYLRRHPRFTAEALVPIAVGRAGKARDDAGAVLRLLTDLGLGTSVREGAAAYGDAVAAAIDEVLATDPVTLLPARVPTLPTWLSAELVPPVTTVGGEDLPLDAMTALVVMFMLSKPGEPYAGIERAVAGLDRASLVAMACGLYDVWRVAGAPAKDSWVIEALGAVGDDEMVAWALAEIRRDPSDARAVSLLDVLVMIGSDAALVALRRIAETVRTARVRTGAEERTQAVADDLGLTADQLADRILPRLGLDDDGVLHVDYGPRSFEVRLDVQMKPVVHDTGGARRKDLPAPGATDDPVLAPRAHAAYKQFKKDVRTHGVDQVKRLEHAMVTSRRFAVTELRDVQLTHPLRRPLLQRLVWATFAGDGVTVPCTGTFRIAEDGTFADIDDRAIDLAADAVIGLAHPALPGTALDRWAAVFADYELVQPFLQLARPWQALDDVALATSTLADRTTGLDSRHFLSIERKGFDRPEVGDGGYLRDFVRQLPHGRTFHLTIEPGVYMGDPTMEPQQAIVDAVLRAGPDDDHDPTFADIGPVATSELLVDLASLRS